MNTDENSFSVGYLNPDLQTQRRNFCDTDNESLDILCYRHLTYVLKNLNASVFIILIRYCT